MNALLNKLDFSALVEADDFTQELRLLAEDRYQRGDRPAHLLVIYRRLVAELTPFARQVRDGLPAERQEPLLGQWLM